MASVTEAPKMDRDAVDEYAIEDGVVEGHAEYDDVFAEHEAILTGMEIYSSMDSALPEGMMITGGDFSQVLELNLMPGEVVTSEPGTLLHMSRELDMDMDMGGIAQACKRSCCAQESFFRLVFHNKTDQPQALGLTPNFPSKIIPIDLTRYNGITIKSGAFMAALGADWHVQLRLVNSVGMGCCGGQGFVLNSLHGSGIAFISAGGTILTKSLGEGEEIVVDTNALVGFEKTIKYSVKAVGGISICCCGGMGLFNTKLTGPGMVILQSMPFEKLVRHISTQSQSQA